MKKLYMRRNQIIRYLESFGISASETEKSIRAGALPAHHFRENSRAYYRRDDAEKAFRIAKEPPEISN